MRLTADQLVLLNSLPVTAARWRDGFPKSVREAVRLLGLIKWLPPDQVALSFKGLAALRNFRRRRPVVKAEVSGVSARCLSQWRLTLACGNVQYRLREPWNRGRGGRLRPAPKYAMCGCRVCRGVAGKPVGHP
jgi:hypothetical protein